MDHQKGLRIGKSQKARLVSGLSLDDRYEIIELAGDGGISTVYKSRDTHADRLVAVKLLHTSLITDYEEIVRLKKEGKILSQIDCPNVATIYRFGLIEEKLPYVVTEFLSGFNLKEVLDTQDEPLGATLAIHVGLQVCDALKAGHNAGVIHGDVKPSNIVIVEKDAGEIVKVTDFGLSRNLASSSESITMHLTETGLLTTSVPYMSPEQCLGKQVDARSDIYSLGCLLFEMATGRHPFVSQDPIAVARQHVSGVLSRNSFCNLSVPDELQNVILKAMSKEPSQRYDSIEEMKQALVLINEKQEESAQKIRIVTRKKMIRPGIIRLAVVIAALIIGVLCWIKQFF